MGINQQTDLLSELGDLDLFRHLIADLHDDLFGKITRSRQLIDLSENLGSSGTMLFGGETTFHAWQEARWSFIHGNFIATVLLCQGLAEHLLASYLDTRLLPEHLPKRIPFAETLRRCIEQNVIPIENAKDLRQLMELRNPLSHYRDVNDQTNLTSRALATREPASEHLRRDAGFAIQVLIRILALPAFRLGN